MLKPVPPPVSPAPGRPATGDFYEFGPFRLDAPARSLYRGDEFVMLTPKAFDTLCLLVEEAGTLVTKDALLQRVWPDAFVEEGSIANNISSLRKILNPHFDGDGPIATVSRRGYRFVAPVQLRNHTASIAVVSDSGKHAAITAIPEEANEEHPGHPVQPVPPAPMAPMAPLAQVHPSHPTHRTHSTHLVMASLAGILVLGAVGYLTTINSKTATQSEARSMRRAVAVLPMINLSGKPEYSWFSIALSESINTELVAGGQLRMISGPAVAQVVEDAAPKPGMHLSRRQLDDLGQRLGTDFVLSGSYRHDRGRVRVDLRLDAIATGATVATVGLEDSEDKLLDLVAQANRELRAALGLTAPPLKGQPEALRVALTSNPAALRLYFLGLEALRNHEINRSTELLTQAIDEDPDFALAHTVLSTSWRVLGYDDKSEASARRAFDLSARLGREDQLLVQGAYYAVMNDVTRARETFQALWNFYPDDIAYGLRLTHQQLLGGELDEARVTIDRLRALPPPADIDPRVDVVESDWFFRKAQYADALRVAGSGAGKAKRRKSNQILAILTMTQARSATRLDQLAAARRHAAEAEQLYKGLGDNGGVAEAVLADAVILLTQGLPAEAEQRLEPALQTALTMNHQRLLIELRIRRSEIARAQGKLAQAKSDAEAALTAARTMEHRSAMARALVALGGVVAMQGDQLHARAHFEEAEQLARTIGEPQTLTAATSGLARVKRLEARTLTIAQSSER